MHEGIDPARRGLLRGRLRPVPAPLRPPWARREGFTEACTRCGLCFDACPAELIALGDGGFPEIDFSRGECVFCAACAEACPAPAFDRNGRAWDIVAATGPGCFARSGIVCRSCRDACPESAIAFTLQPGGVALPGVQPEACTGCGACVSACPAGAVFMKKSGDPSHVG